MGVHRIWRPASSSWAHALFVFFCLLSVSLTAPAAETVSAELGLGLQAYSKKEYSKAYELFLPLARNGDPSMQNVVGFMLFLGKGVNSDPLKAHRWFHKAAENGSVEAKLNLAAIHESKNSGVAHDLDEFGKWMMELPPPPPNIYGVQIPAGKEQLLEVLRTTKPVLVVDPVYDFPGRKLFKTFCAGCHGFDGMAFFPGAPSFLMGERLQRTNEDLKRSVLKGKNMMPGWENVLPESHIDAALFYLRAIALLSRYGLLSDPDVLDQYYYFYYPDIY